jgi:hypothetical protein
MKIKWMNTRLAWPMYWCVRNQYIGQAKGVFIHFIFISCFLTHQYIGQAKGIHPIYFTGYENKMDEYTFSLINVLICKETGYENKMDEYTFRLTKQRFPALIIVLILWS